MINSLNPHTRPVSPVPTRHSGSKRTTQFRVIFRQRKARLKTLLVLMLVLENQSKQLPSLVGLPPAADNKLLRNGAIGIVSAQFSPSSIYLRLDPDVADLLALLGWVGPVVVCLCLINFN